MTTYWISDPCSLFNSNNINPFVSDDKNFKFNSLTRLIIVVTLFSSLLFSSMNTEILVAGVISLTLSVVIYLLTYNSNGSVGNPPEKLTNEIDENKESDENKNRLVNYLDAEKTLKAHQKEILESMTPVGEKINIDHSQNSQNLINLNHIQTKNTQQLKGAFHMDQVKTKNINDITSAENNRKTGDWHHAGNIQPGTFNGGLLKSVINNLGGVMRHNI